VILSKECINTDDALNGSPFERIDDALGVFVDDGRCRDEIGVDVLDTDILLRNFWTRRFSTVFPDADERLESLINETPDWRY
jgi:hypothetical protein